MQHKTAVYFFLFITGCCALFSFVSTFKEIEENGNMDLREKIVGARLLSSGQSPYFYKWKNGDDGKLLDPFDNFNFRISRIAVNPAALLCFVPLSKLNYGTIKWLWFAFSYACFFLILFQFYILAKQENKFIVLIAGSLFFLCSVAWQMHMERGQVYIFYTLVLSSVYWFYKRENYFSAGALLAFLCWFRLPFLLFIPLLSFLSGRNKIIIGFFSSIILLVLIALTFTTKQNWKDYFSSMEEWSKFELHEVSAIPNAIKPDFPSQIEGEVNLEIAKDFLQNNRAIQCIVLWLLNIKLYTKQLLLLFVASFLVLSSIICFKWRKSKIIFSETNIFILAFLFYILSDYFLPAPSYSYHYIQWLFPILLIVSSKNIRINFSFSLILLGLCMNLSTMSLLPYNLAIGEAILFAGVFVNVLSD